MGGASRSSDSEDTPGIFDLTVVGLGPGPAVMWTEAVRSSLTGSDPVWLRTRRHASASALLALRPDARDFDDVYDGAEALPSVYREIARRLTDMAATQPIVYAVPGSPAVGEDSVRHVRRAAASRGLRVRELPGVSFLEPVLAVLGWDALDGLQTEDAMTVAALDYPPLNPDRPALLAQIYSRLVASDVKLVLLGMYPPDHGVTLIRGAGTADVRRIDCTLATLDHREDFDDETTLAVPPRACPEHFVRRAWGQSADASISGLAQAASLDNGPSSALAPTAPTENAPNVSALAPTDPTENAPNVSAPAPEPLPVGSSLATMGQMMARLRSERGCPWDLEQTHLTLRPFLLEEAHETLEALDLEDPARLCEELGDLLLQIVFHAQIASEAGDFNLADVVCGITTKIVARHPHVFGGPPADSAEEVLRRWEGLKRTEKAGRGIEHDPFEGVPRTLPALARAQQIQERAERAGLPSGWDQRGQADREQSTGVALWAEVRAARAAGVDAEDALRAECERQLIAARQTSTQQEGEPST